MGAEGISATVSEKTPTRKRGRPRRFSVSLIRDFEAMQRHFGFAHSPRTVQNLAYQAAAETVIRPLVVTYPELRWLFDDDAMKRGERYHRPTILQALGQITSEELLVKVARVLCEQKPTARKAVAAIRRFRQVQKPANLTEALRSALNDYLWLHPDVTLAQARDAVGQLWSVLDEQIES